MMDKYISPQHSDGEEQPDQVYQIITDGPQVDDAPEDQKYLEQFLNNNQKVVDAYADKPLSAIPEDHAEDNLSIIQTVGKASIISKQ